MFVGRQRIGHLICLHESGLQIVVNAFIDKHSQERDDGEQFTVDGVRSLKTESGQEVMFSDYGRDKSSVDVFTTSGTVRLRVVSNSIKEQA